MVGESNQTKLNFPIVPNLRFLINILYFAKLLFEFSEGTRVIFHRGSVELLGSITEVLPNSEYILEYQGSLESFLSTGLTESDCDSYRRLKSIPGHIKAEFQVKTTELVLPRRIVCHYFCFKIVLVTKPLWKFFVFIFYYPCLEVVS